MKLERHQLAHFLDTTPKGSARVWYRIGKDVEDLSVELNPTTEQTKNILDETSTNLTGYEPSIGVDTYYANPDDAIYPILSDIVKHRHTGDQLKTTYLEVLIEDTDDASHFAYTEDVILVVSSYGGAQGGVRIPYTISFCGNRKEGTATLAGGVPTFTPSN